MVIFKKVIIQKGYNSKRLMYIHTVPYTEKLTSKFENRYERTKIIQEQFSVNIGSMILNLNFHLSLIGLYVSRLSQ